MGKRQEAAAARRREHADRKPGLSLTKFAKAKSNTYDKRAVKEQQRALHARKLSKYSRLKARLEKEGRLEPLLPNEGLANDDSPSKEDKDRQRALRRAGPALEESSSDEDAVGEASPPGSPPHSQDFPNAAVDRQAGQAEPANSPSAAAASGGRHGKRVRDPEGTSFDAEPTGKRKKRQKPPSQVQILAAKVQAQKDKKRAEREAKRREAEERQKRIALTESRRKKEREVYLKRTKRGQPVMKHRMDKLASKLEAELAQ